MNSSVLHLHHRKKGKDDAKYENEERHDSVEVLTDELDLNHGRIEVNVAGTVRTSCLISSNLSDYGHVVEAAHSLSVIS